MLKYWFLKFLKQKIVYLKIVMKICLSLVLLSQMINYTGDVKYEIYCVNMVLIMYGCHKMLLMKIYLCYNLSSEL